MDLIIRVTGKCNFDCTFCSAGNLNIGHPANGVPDQIKDVINTIHPSEIVISGGEPLLVGPDYYWELLDIGKCRVSITSNLKDFYFNPDIWVKLFQHPMIGLTTSFNYGDARRWDPNTVYDEEKFIEVYKLFEEKVGKSIPFIAVIDENNEDTVIKTVQLAKRLGTSVRINNALKQGRCGKTYPRYKLFKKYIEIVEAGLSDYEVYCKNKGVSACPLNMQMLCKSSIRTCYVDKDNKLHYYGCSDSYDEIPLNYYDDINLKPHPCYPGINECVNSKCMSCELYSLCNSCDTQKNEYPPEHCDEMQKLKAKLIKQGWVKELLP